MDVLESIQNWSLEYIYLKVSLVWNITYSASNSVFYWSSLWWNTKKRPNVTEINKTIHLRIESVLVKIKVTKNIKIKNRKQTLRRNGLKKELKKKITANCRTTICGINFQTAAIPKKFNSDSLAEPILNQILLCRGEERKWSLLLLPVCKDFRSNPSLLNTTKVLASVQFWALYCKNEESSEGIIGMIIGLHNVAYKKNDLIHVIHLRREY